MLGGFLIVIWIICPILWGMSISASSPLDICLHFLIAKNVFYSQFIPMSVGMSFDNAGNPYNLSGIVTNNAFDQAKYEQYSPMFLPITYIVTYGTFFATYPATIVHVFLWYRHDIVRQFRRNLKDETDIHAHLMRNYPEVPRWWFLALGLICVVLGIVGIEICNTGTPIWAFVIALIFAGVFVLPFGIMQAVTNQQFFLNVLAEVFIGYILPGHPLASMIFKIVAGDTADQAILYCSDLKFGHYLKVPPRLLFIGQVFATVIALLSSILSQEWALDHIPDICSHDQNAFFTCPNLDLFTTASIIWGGIGPKRLFSHGAL